MHIAIETALCVFMLLSTVFFIVPMGKLHKKYNRFYQMIVLAVVAEFCGFLISLPSLDSPQSHFISSPAILNALSVVFVLSWVPQGAVIYHLSQLVFAGRPFIISRLMKFIFPVVFGIVCLCLYLSGLPFETWYPQVVLFSFIVCVIVPLALMALNLFLLWIENPRAREERYTAIFSWLSAVYIVVSLVLDVILPLVLENKIYYEKIWQGAVLLFAMYALAFTLVSYLRVKVVSDSKMVYSLFRSLGDGVVVYNKTGRIYFANVAASTLLDLQLNETRKENVKNVFKVQAPVEFFKERYMQSLELLVHGKKETFSSIVIKDSGLLDSRCFILIFSKNLEDLQKSLGFKATLLREQLEQQSVLQKMQQEVRRQETLLKTFLDNLPMQVSVKNEAGVVILQNRADMDANGKLVGMTEPVTSAAERRAFEGFRGTYDKVIYNEDKKSIKQAFNYSFVPVVDEPNANMVLKICRDVTESLNVNLERLRMLENEKRHAHLEELGTLTGGIAHEFNNILGSQLGFLSLIKTLIPEDSPARKYLEQVEIAGERQKQLIQKLLASTRSELSTVSEETAEFPLASLAMNLLSSLRKSMPQNVQIENEIVDSDLRLVGSEIKLGQVLSNLLNNAVYAMREKGGVLSTTAEVVHLDVPLEEGSPWAVPPGDYVCIKISDTGEGIPSNVLQRLFSPLFTTKPPGEGLGLGLYTSLSLVRAAHGEVTVQSTLGKGTTFKVYWPLAKK